MNDARYGSALGVPSRSGRPPAVASGTLFAAGTVFVLVAVVTLVFALTGSAVAGRAVAGQRQATGPAPLDARTNPCQLVDTVRLGHYGNVHLLSDYGPYSGCRLYLSDRRGGETDLSVYLNGPGESDSVDSQSDQIGDVTVYRWPRRAQSCVRALTRTPGSPENTDSVTVIANRVAGHGPDVCTVGNALAADLAHTIAGQPPRNPPGVARDSVTGRDACSLLTPREAAAVPGTDTAVTRGFAGWSCYWGSAWNVSIVYGRDFLHGGDGAGLSRAQDGCSMRLQRGRFAGIDGDERVETVDLAVSATHRTSVDRACAYARKLSTTVSLRLPSV